jgi:hypothetical protein
VRRIVKLGEKEAKLSPKEYDLLRLLGDPFGLWFICVSTVSIACKPMSNLWSQIRPVCLQTHFCEGYCRC